MSANFAYTVYSLFHLGIYTLYTTHFQCCVVQIDGMDPLLKLDVAMDDTLCCVLRSQCFGRTINQNGTPIRGKNQIDFGTNKNPNWSSNQFKKDVN